MPELAFMWIATCPPFTRLIDRQLTSRHYHVSRKFFVGKNRIVLSLHKFDIFP